MGQGSGGGYQETESILGSHLALVETGIPLCHLPSWLQKTLRCHFRRPLNMVGMVLRQTSQLGKGEAPCLSVQLPLAKISLCYDTDTGNQYLMGYVQSFIN